MTLYLGNFTVWALEFSVPKWLTYNHSMTFNADSIVNPISLVSFIESQRSDHVFNGLGIMSSFVSLFWTEEKLQIGVLLSFICILFYFIFWIFKCKEIYGFEQPDFKKRILQHWNSLEEVLYSNLSAIHRFHMMEVLL